MTLPLFYLFWHILKLLNGSNKLLCWSFEYKIIILLFHPKHCIFVRNILICLYFYSDFSTFFIKNAFANVFFYNFLFWRFYDCSYCMPTSYRCVNECAESWTQCVFCQRAVYTGTVYRDSLPTLGLFPYRALSPQIRLCADFTSTVWFYSTISENTLVFWCISLARDIQVILRFYCIRICLSCLFIMCQMFHLNDDVTCCSVP